ncbi:MAG: IS5 family transposase [Bacteroidales bacterium]|nr:IS5 family transposase [Bacteroidales bacterium]
MKSKEKGEGIAEFFMNRRKVKETFFNQMNRIVDWSRLRPIIEKGYAKGTSHTGRPCYDAMVLFRIELLRTWYNLSDVEVEEQVNDRLSFSRFAGIRLDEASPDSTTIGRFRNALVKANVYDSILSEINRQLENAGVIVKSGAIVDASVTDSPRRPRGRKQYVVVEDRCEEDGAEESERAFLKEMEKPNVDNEARWVRKAGKLRFGYKRHTATDMNGLILAEETTAANESDTVHMRAPLEKAGLAPRTPVYADKGYASRENNRMLGERKLKSRIMHKGVRGRDLSQREQRVNVGISRVRYRIERTYGSIHRWFGGGVARYVGLAKTHAQHIMEAIAYNLYRTPGIIVSSCE